MKPSTDTIYIVSPNATRAEDIRQAIVLRGFDEIRFVPYEQAIERIGPQAPAVLLVDVEENPDRALTIMRQIPEGVQSLVLAPFFDEGVFVSFHDLGARDFLVHPIPQAYLASRVIQALKAHRQKQIYQQQLQTLVDMGVIAKGSKTFTTHHLLQQLETLFQSEVITRQRAMSLLLVQPQDDTDSLSPETLLRWKAIAGPIIRDSARGGDIVGEYLVDKFAVILPDTGPEGLQALARRLKSSLQEKTRLPVRIGMAESTHCKHYEALLNKALSNLQNAHARRNKIQPGPIHPV